MFWDCGVLLKGGLVGGLVSEKCESEDFPMPS